VFGDREICEGNRGELSGMENCELSSFEWWKVDSGQREMCG
jgi:hypothetical protein